MEPVRVLADRDVDLGGLPLRAGGVAVAQQLQPGGVLLGPAVVEAAPARVGRLAGLVADPAQVGAAEVAEEHGLRLPAVARGDDLRPRVVGLLVDGALLAGPAVESVAAVGAVEPDLRERPVLREELLELAQIVVAVGGRPVVGAVAVPGRKVEPGLDALGGAGIDELAHDVAPAAAPRRVADAVLRPLRRPEAEAVVVLGGEDEARHAALAGDARPLAAVERGGREDRGILVAVAPLEAGERVGREVDEAVERLLVPGELARAGKRDHRARSAARTRKTDAVQV